MKASIKAVLSGLVLLVVGCSGEPNELDKSSNYGGREQLVTKEDFENLYDDNWAFEPKELIISCRPKPNSTNRLVTAKIPGVGGVYGLNGTAMSYFDSSIHDLRATDENGERVYGGSSLTKLGLSLCEPN